MLEYLTGFLIWFAIYDYYIAIGGTALIVAGFLYWVWRFLWMSPEEAQDIKDAAFWERMNEYKPPAEEPTLLPSNNDSYMTVTLPSNNHILIANSQPNIDAYSNVEPLIDDKVLEVPPINKPKIVPKKGKKK